MTVGAKEFGPSGDIDFSVGDDGVVAAGVWSCSDALLLHADSTPMTATPEIPTHAAIFLNINCVVAMQVSQLSS